uniref:Transmembrane 9 superfamily member n=1 Tax=Heterorhabditis bacteriophora TaxID=37862 RepID=A0A1I7XC35_HETBA
MGGILPFGSIFIEIDGHTVPNYYRYFIFTSFWAYKIYYVYGFMLLVTIILSIVTVCVTIVCSYFLLNAEDYRWLVYCSSYLEVDKFYGWSINCILRVSILCLLFLLQDKNVILNNYRMFGLFQTVFYFGYMGIFSAALGLMAGTIGYVGTAKFVRKIYSTVKID